MRSSRLVTLGGPAALIGALMLIVEGVMTAAGQTLGTIGDLVVWAGLGLVAIGAVALIIGMFSAGQDLPHADELAPDS
jgi:hypothetical protein